MTPNKITKGTFSILTHKQGSKPQDGYVLGDVFGIHKLGKSWVVTHIASGNAIGVLSRPNFTETKAAVLAAAELYDWSGKDIFEICKVNKVEPQELRRTCYQINR